MSTDRELDARVARDVMGLPIGACRELYWTGTEEGRVRCRIPAYSTDIASAWEVVENMEGRGWKVVYLTVGRAGRRVEVRVPRDGWAGDELYTAEADTAPLAICRAALQALTTPPNQRRSEP